MVAMWLAHQLRNFWWWLRGVDLSSYHTRCVRCGYNGRVHLALLGCRRYVKPPPIEGDEG
jgi:hypothetical protein